MKKPYKFQMHVIEGTNPKRYRWRTIGPNGNIVNHQYNSKSGCRRSMDKFIADIRAGNYIIEDKEITNGLRKATKEARGPFR